MMQIRPPHRCPLRLVAVSWSVATSIAGLAALGTMVAGCPGGDETDGTVEAPQHIAPVAQAPTGHDWADLVDATGPGERACATEVRSTLLGQAELPREAAARWLAALDAETATERRVRVTLDGLTPWLFSTDGRSLAVVTPVGRVPLILDPSAPLWRATAMGRHTPDPVPGGVVETWWSLEVCTPDACERCVGDRCNGCDDVPCAAGTITLRHTTVLAEGERVFEATCPAER